VCFFTDGLIEARRGDAMIGRLGLVDIIRELGPHATATQLLDRIAGEADDVSDDMAACMFRVSDGPNEAYLPRVEEIEVGRDEPLDATLGRFLTACGLDPEASAATVERARRTVRQFRGAVVRVSLPSGGPRVEVRPANVESLVSADARRAAV
jgi:stage II sporulation SpoE-like protein